MIKRIDSIEEMYNFSIKKKQAGYSIGFVPTMGALHEGHLSLVEESKKKTDITIVSIFVNPTQFGENEDLDTYPRMVEEDISLLEDLEADVVFLPTKETIYPENYQTYVNVTKMTNILCGAKRPGHFQGVTTIVSKLMNIVSADFMFMGEKDFQQVAVLRKMISDLNFHTKIVTCPIIREKDGLAKSSRNLNLTKENRKLAVSLYESMQIAQKEFTKGKTNVKDLISLIEDFITSKEGIVDYIEIRDSKNLKIPEKIYSGCRIFLAIKYGNVRLIDNQELH